MADSSLNLNILIQAQNQATSVFESLGTSVGSIFSGLGNSISNVAFGVRNLGTEGTIGMDALKTGMSGVGTAVLQIGALAAVAGAAVVVGIGVKAVQAAGDYEQGLNKVKALTGSNTDQMKYYDAQIKQLAVDAGVAPTKLTDGLYNVLSASYKGADATKVLTLATEDSKIGMTSATVTTDALTNVLRSFGVQSKDITGVNGQMLETVTLGKATFEQYATTIVKAASASTQFHVSMETMNAAWSTMTSSGIRAAQASTDYQQSLKVMYGNIGSVTASLHKNGIAFDETKFNAMSYGDKVQYLNKALEIANEKHVKVTGVTIQAAQAISTISKHIGDYNSNLASLSNKQAMAAKTQEAWAVTQGGFNQSMDRVKAAFDVMLITIGQKLLPVLSRLAQQFAPLIGSFTQWLVSSGALQGAIDFLVGTITNMINTGTAIVSFFQQNEFAMDMLKVTLALLAIVIGVAVVVALYSMATAAWIAVAPFIPLIIIVLAVIAVIALIVMAVQHWGQIAHWLQGVWGAFSAWFMGLWGALGAWLQGALKAIGAFFTAAWNWVVNAAKTAFLDLILVIGGPIVWIGLLIFQHWAQIKAWLQEAWQWILNTAKTLWQDVVNIFANAWSGISGAITNLWNGIKNFFAGLPAQMMQFGINLINGFINGIKSMLGAVGNAASNVMNTVKSFLGFHSPAEKGPGAELNTWGPNMVKGFSQGMLQAKPQLQASLNLLMQPVKQSLTAPVSGSSSGASGGGSAGGTTVINLTVNATTRNKRDMEELSQEIIQKISKELRRGNNIVTMTSGGRSGG